MPSVTVTISEEDLVVWIAELPRTQRNEETARALRVGRLVLWFARTSTDTGTLAEFFGPITDRMDQFEESLERIVHRSMQSEGRGLIGEAVAEVALQRANPNDQFTRVGAAARTADLAAVFAVGGARSTPSSRSSRTRGRCQGRRWTISAGIWPRRERRSVSS